MVYVKFFEQIIGSLLYLSLRSRPDMLTPVPILARFQNSPTAYFHQAAKRVLRYLRGISKHVLLYNFGLLKIQGYVDSGYAGDMND